jgi:hypothetical protein
MYIYPTQRERMIRDNPEAGFYRAKLLEINRYTKKNGADAACFKWELLSHPIKEHCWVGVQFFGITNPGLLAQMIHDWKNLRWQSFLARCPYNLPYPEIFLDQEADLVILPPPEKGSYPSNVGQVLPPGKLVTLRANGAYEAIPNPSISEEEEEDPDL